MTAPTWYRRLLVALIALASAPAIVFALLTWLMNAQGGLPVRPTPTSDVFLIAAAASVFSTPVAVVLTLALTVFKSVSRASKVLCWMLTLAAVAATLQVIETFRF